MRDGDFKALKIGANAYLFNVVDDPLERSDLKKKYPDIYQRLTGPGTLESHHAAGGGQSYTYNNDAASWADHIKYTADRTPHATDDGDRWPS